MLTRIKFGTDGWRAIIGKDFNLANVQAVTQAIADYLLQTAKGKRQTAKVVVGYDNRKLSPEAARRISQVLAANGIKVILSNQPLPVQAVSHAVISRRLTAGIMITASHNPARFNGIKIKGAFGGPVDKEITNKIERLILKRKALKISLAQARKMKLVRIINLVPDYLKLVRSFLEFSLFKKGCLNILVDAMHGTSDSYIAKLLQGTPCKVTTIHKDKDYSFGGIKPEPIQACLKQATSLMKKGRFDIGLACDGDADRIAALSPQGKFITPQQIISLLLLHLLRRRRLKGAVVKTISGTTLLERIAGKYKLKVYETPIGFKHISRLMQNKDVLIGGEEAGGIGFKNYLPERDGILAGLLLLEMMLAEKKPITALLQETEQEFGRYFYLRKDLKCLPRDKAKAKTRLTSLRRRKSFSGIKVNKVKDYDGLKFCLADGSWILFRLSGTEPILRIYAESDSLAKTKRLIKRGQAPFLYTDG